MKVTVKCQVVRNSKGITLHPLIRGHVPVQMVQIEQDILASRMKMHLTSQRCWAGNAVFQSFWLSFCNSFLNGPNWGSAIGVAAVVASLWLVWRHGRDISELKQQSVTLALQQLP